MMFITSADGTFVINVNSIKYAYIRENVLADTMLDAFQWELVTDQGVVIASSDVKPPSAGEWLARMLETAGEWDEAEDF